MIKCVPNRLVPALAIGFPSIQKRVEGQHRMTLAHQASLSEISSHLTTLSSTHSLETSLRTLKASQTSLVLAERLMRLIAKTSAIGSNRNTGVRKEEEELRIGLEGMLKGVEQGKERVGELWSRVGQLKARKVVEGERIEWAVADEDGLRQILEVSFFFFLRLFLRAISVWPHIFHVAEIE
jgi:nuclear pore complex protein Nup54